MKTIKSIVLMITIFITISVIITAMACGNQSIEIGILTALFASCNTWIAFGGYIFSEMIALLISIALTAILKSANFWGMKQ